ncbi:MAG: DNA (cytosine-5-)-methyltransferase [Aphanothece sp. CMT-3BRIN-NPC111]|nr:DNA (cytosine-5-)-methyltransferase [Aphanothece sp. CMT-3BRIN-NPC111]
MLAGKHSHAFSNILYKFKEAGYNVSYQLLNAKKFEVSQDRKRLIIVGYHKKLGEIFEFTKQSQKVLTLKDAIYDLRLVEPIQSSGKVEKYYYKVPNHEYLDMEFSSIYMSRNRVRSWSEPSFTIQAGGRHAPIHPQANKMIFVEPNRRIFDPSSSKPYRRLSVRECARIQTFPDNFIFKYKNIAGGYKMVGNAVPVNFARILANKIMADMQEYHRLGFCTKLHQIEFARQLSLINL